MPTMADRQKEAEGLFGKMPDKLLQKTKTLYSRELDVARAEAEEYQDLLHLISLEQSRRIK